MNYKFGYNVEKNVRFQRVKYDLWSVDCFGARVSGISGIPKNFVWGGGQQIQLRIDGRENGDLGL
jgi:hypothetical protein